MNSDRHPSHAAVGAEPLGTTAARGLVRAVVAAALLLTALAGALPLAAQSDGPHSLAAVVGHRFGERITVHHQMVRYLEHLAEATDRVRLVVQGYSEERRPLPLAIVSSPDNLARLEQIRASAGRLHDARTVTAAEAESLISDQPLIVWYGGSIHGFELSGSEGALRLLELLATGTDADVMKVLAEAVVLIDPMLNPDGRDAFAHENHERTGRLPNPSRSDWNNSYNGFEALRFRTTHYFFDGNRDWFAQTQKVSQAHARTLVEWHPQVAVDMHEMGSDIEFYFDPPARPFGPYLGDYALEWYELFGDANARAFEQAGYEYFSRERYNYFYPGYSEAFSVYQGAVGLLYEQGSTRGLAITRADDTVRTYRQSIDQQFEAAWATLRFAAQRRQDLLRDYALSARRAIEDGSQGVGRYLIEPVGDPQLHRELAELLLRCGIEVGVSSSDTTLRSTRDRAGNDVGARTFAAGTLVIDADQPRNRLVRALLEPHVPMEADFLDQARAAVDRDLNPRFYDKSAWSLPLMFNLSGWSSSDDAEIAVTPLRSDGPRAQRQRPAGQAAYAYVFPGRQARSLTAAARLRTAGYRVTVISRATRIGDQAIDSGSVVLRTGSNRRGDGARPSVHEAVRAVADELDLDLLALDRGWSEPGELTLGTGDYNIYLKEPRIALLTGDPVQGYSFGWAWHKLDQQYQLPLTLLRASTLTAVDLSDFNVLIVPEVSDRLVQVIGDAGKSELERWIRRGGTLVTLGSATELARRHFDLQLDSWYDDGDDDQEEQQQRFSVPGAFFRAQLDLEQWLSAGYSSPELPMYVDSARILLQQTGPPSSRRRVVATVGAGADGGAALISGHAWPESLERLPGAVLLYEQRVGSGRVIAFAEDPNFRGYLRGLDRLFLNAVVLGPSAP